MSSVVGTILMVAIAVMLSIVLGFTIMEKTSNVEEDVYAGVTFIENSNQSITVEWTEKGTANKIKVVSDTETEFINSFNKTVTVAPGRNGTDINVFAIRDSESTFITKYNVPDYLTSMYVESSTCDSPGYCGAEVFLNGSKTFSGKGVNVMVLKPDGSFHSYAWYNTSTNDAYRPPTYTLNSSGLPDMNSEQSCIDCVNRLVADQLQTYRTNDDFTGYYVILVGGGQPGRTGYPGGDSSNGINNDVESEYEKLGANFNNDDILEHNDSWILVTHIGNGLIYEEHAPRGRQSGVGNVSGYVFAGE